MSLILEALKKVERERATPEQRGFLVLGPTAWAPSRSNLAWVLGNGRRGGGRGRRGVPADAASRERGPRGAAAGGAHDAGFGEAPAADARPFRPSPRAGARHRTRMDRFPGPPPSVHPCAPAPCPAARRPVRC